MGQSPNRRRRREMVATEREARLLDGLLAGKTQAQMAMELGIAPSYVSQLLNRALERRALPDGPAVEAARRLYEMRLERLIAAYWPLATGTFRLSDDPMEIPAPPDVRSGELLLKIMMQLASIQSKSLGEAVSQGQRMDVYHHVGDDQRLVDQIMDQLRAAADHGRVVEGSLAAVGTGINLLTGPAELDAKPAAPPDWQPPEPEQEAA